MNALIDEEKARYRPSLRQYLEPFPLPESRAQAGATSRHPVIHFFSLQDLPLMTHALEQLAVGQSMPPLDTSRSASAPVGVAHATRQIRHAGAAGRQEERPARVECVHRQRAGAAGAPAQPVRPAAGYGRVTRGRLDNLELLGKYGVNAWKVHTRCGRVVSGMNGMTAGSELELMEKALNIQVNALKSAARRAAVPSRAQVKDRRHEPPAPQRAARCQRQDFVPREQVGGAQGAPMC